jgi:hypothetical protein
VENRLLYRRQFLIARQSVAVLSDWEKHQISHYWLHVHPDLDVTIVKDGKRAIFLMGYLFDPEKYTSSNEDVLKRVLFATKNFGDLIQLLKPYAGRYALVYQDHECLNLIQDALALREVYYCDRENQVVCGSQPNLLSTFSEPKIQGSMDPVLIDFVQNQMPQVRNGRLWPGDGTAYEGVKHLLPNHYLDLTTLTVKRYWPNTDLKKMELDEAVRRSAAFLQGVMKAAAHRYPLMLAVTAGEDSRALLAACRNIKNSVYFFINKHDKLSDKSGDIRIPIEIFKRIGIPFNVHNYEKNVPDEFKRIFYNNTFYAKEIMLPVIYNVYHRLHSNRVNILGVGEVGRTKFFDEPKKLTPYYLSYMLKYRKSRYSVRECETWLEDAMPVARKFNLNIMTLFWWEVLIGNWGAVGNSESDIAIEEFDPYNSHLLYETFLSVDAKYRTFRGNILFKKLISFMWPELLAIPLNPPENIKDRFVGVLHKYRIEIILRMFKFRLYEVFYKFYNYILLHKNTT